MHDAPDPSDRLQVAEAAIRAAFERGDLQSSAHEIFARYGREVFGFLVARLRSREDAREVFAILSEDIWRGLPNFAFRCSVRCWTYTLARNAAYRYAHSSARASQRNRPLPTHPSSLAYAAVAPTHDVALRTTTRQRVRALRDHLQLEDQTLLILHVDRGLPWRELAQVLHGEELAPTALDREVVRIRKRFERIKKQLRRLAIAEGLLEQDVT